MEAQKIHFDKKNHKTLSFNCSSYFSHHSLFFSSLFCPVLHVAHILFRRKKEQEAGGGETEGGGRVERSQGEQSFL